MLTVHVYLGVTLLHEAVVDCSDDTVEALLQNNASIEALNTSQDTVLQAVIKVGRQQVLDLLITERGEKRRRRHYLTLLTGPIF